MDIKKIGIERAMGLPLAHDLTQIVPGRFKGVAFKRGYVIRSEDIPRLKAMGKENVYVLELSPEELHEDDASVRIARAVASRDFSISEPCEGKVSLKSRFTGLLKVDRASLSQINSLDGIILSTLHNYTLCRPGMVVAATRIVSLVIEESRINTLERLCRDQGKILSLLPLKPKRVGVIITGNEIYHGLIKDSSGDIVRAKLETYGSRVTRRIIVPDDPGEIARTIHFLREEGCEVIMATGGLSVDPDDVTVEGVKEAGAKIIFYGVPVLPGSMLLYALLGETPILGIPACIIYNKATSLDIILPKILAGEEISNDHISILGYGGLCLQCSVCHFPACCLGKV